jgi:membrane protein DedA with SNARE-associated domain
MNAIIGHTVVGLPLGFAEWIPAAQAGTLGLLTLVQEDLPAVSAALLAAAGTLRWQTGFLGVFLGIWMGDALLYLIARGVGRGLLQRSWAARFLDPAAVARSERWFAAKGTWLLVSSRFVPGTRLPTYLAAGFLRLSFGRFLLATGAAVGAWTCGIFLLAKAFGPELLTWLRGWSSGGWVGVLLVAALAVVIHLAVQCARADLRRRLGAAMGRLVRWEFWPTWLFYAPVAVNYARLAIRYRGLTLPTAANPGISSGGFVGESKIATLRDLQATSPEFTAEAYLVEGATGAERLACFERLRAGHRLELPFVLKPDIGQRGVGVKLVRSMEQAEAYVAGTSAPLVVQRYAPGPMEAGVFYYRFPNEARGRIFAITEKIFPIITGDGRQTIENLVWADSRARFVAETYLRRLGPRRSEIPAAGATVRLVEAGNHAQGCVFRNGMQLWTEELERSIDEISRRLGGFFIGRYDIRYASESELRSGRGFQIIELNGAASEATSIYDARNSLVAAYRTLFRQWDLVFAIGAANRRLGTRPTDVAELWRAWRQTAALVATYPMAD